MIGQTATASVAVAVTLPVVEVGEAWVLTLTSGGVATSYSFTATDTLLQTVLDELAAKVNADTATLYTADVLGSSLVVFQSGAAAFQAGLSVVAAAPLGRQAGGWRGLSADVQRRSYRR